MFFFHPKNVNVIRERALNFPKTINQCSVKVCAQLRLITENDYKISENNCNL